VARDLSVYSALIAFRTSETEVGSTEDDDGQSISRSGLVYRRLNCCVSSHQLPTSSSLPPTSLSSLLSRTEMEVGCHPTSAVDCLGDGDVVSSYRVPSFSGDRWGGLADGEEERTKMVGERENSTGARRLPDLR
jgi:hypothetical protein